LESVLSILQREARTHLHELSGSSLLHSLEQLRSSERRSTLLETSELSGLRDDRLETQSGLDVRNVLLLCALTLLLRSHLASEALLHRGVPLAGGREDVLEGFLRLSIGDIAGGLTALE
jgi:hypothetical protein